MTTTTLMETVPKMQQIPKTSLASSRRFVDTRHRTKRWNAIQPDLLGDCTLLPSPIDAILPRS